MNERDLAQLEAEARAVVTRAHEHPMLVGEDEAAAVAWAEDALRLVAEVRKLRAALEEIVGYGEGAFGEREKTRDIALAALANEKETNE